MKLNEIDNLSSMMPAMPGQTPTLGAAAPNDPKNKAAATALQTKQKQLQRKTIQDQISALTKQITDLKKQLMTIR